MNTMIHSYVLRGLNTVPVTIEIDLREAKVNPPMLMRRVQSAILAAGYTFPPRLSVEIHPNNINSTALDLPIAVGILVATGQVAGLDRDAAYFGELSLMGGVVGVHGTLAVALQAKVDGRNLVGLEAAVAAASIGGDGYVLTRLSDLRHTLPRATPIESPLLPPNNMDMDMRGYEEAISTLVDAAHTCRPVVLLGPVGCGKTKLATHATTLMPPLLDAEAIEVAMIQNVAGFRTILQGVRSSRPFRAPHHTISQGGLVGGTTLRPGEATLAHRGVLFLDEYPNFPLSHRKVVDRLIVDKYVTPCRPGGDDRFPADAWVIIAAQPCPCGIHGHPSCTCSKEMIEQHTRPVQEFVQTHNASVIRLIK